MSTVYPGHDPRSPGGDGGANAARGAIAIVAVHGVGDQKPDESARAIANLLTDLCPLGTYSTFSEEGIRVPVEPLRLHEPARAAATAEEQGGSRGWRFEERNRDALRRHARGAVRSSEAEAAGDHGAVEDTVPPDIAFMRDQLRDYEPEPNAVFETVRLRGTHARSGTPVHVYEAYWGDLSRPAGSTLSFFVELAQLLLHLPSLGRNALDYARAAYPGSRAWVWFSWLHRWSIRWLVLFIACLNMVMASLVVPVLATRLLRGSAETPWSSSMVVAHAAMTLGALGLAFYALYASRTVPWWAWFLIPPIAAALGWFLAAQVIARAGVGRVVTLEAWLLSAILVLVLLRYYEQMRPGAWVTGIVALLATGAFLVTGLWTAAPGEEGCLGAVMRPVEVVGASLAVAWRIHVPWMLVAILAGVLAASVSSREDRGAAWRTVWTAQASLAVSTILFANITLACWDALFTVLRRTIREDAIFTPVTVWPPLSGLLCLPTSPLRVGEYITQSLNVSASRTFIGTTVALAVFAVVVVWSIFPAALVEAVPPRRQAAEADRMRALGIWITRGLHLVPLSTWGFPLLYLFVVGVTVEALRNGTNCLADPPSVKAIALAGVLLLSLFAARFWLPGASRILDVVLDVDNYLRQHPKHDTPRARMAARHASLLRFLVLPERSGHRYSSIVIVAHSQGTVITADLLRFLKHEGVRRGEAAASWSEALKSRDIALLTMGCPLRQLYARAFPWLYAWVEPRSGRGLHPHPDDLDVATWVNAYRSGDYVGRALWRDETVEGVWDRRARDPQDDGSPDVTELAGGRCQEMCIGEGAHTHYWDRYGGDIARQLDSLVSERAAAAR